jgi:hypothetical protein
VLTDQPSGLSDELHRPTSRPGGSTVLLGGALAAACDHLRRGIFLMSEDRRLVFANRPARCSFAAADAIEEIEGRIVLRELRQMNRLCAYLERQAATQPSLAVPGMALKLERANGHPAYRLLLNRLDPAVLDARGVLYLGMIFEPHAARQVPRELLVELYGLTSAEAGVASDLFAGQTVSELRGRAS